MRPRMANPKFESRRQCRGHSKWNPSLQHCRHPLLWRPTVDLPRVIFGKPLSMGEQMANGDPRRIDRRILQILQFLHVAFGSVVEREPPSSRNLRMASAVKLLVIDAMRKTVSVVTAERVVSSR